MEGEPADKKVRRLLVATDLAESHGARAVAVGLLNASSGGSRLESGLGGQLLPEGLASGTLAGYLLRTCDCSSKYLLQVIVLCLLECLLTVSFFG